MDNGNFLDADPGSIIVNGVPNLPPLAFVHSSFDDARLDPYEYRIWFHLLRRTKDRVAWPAMRSISETTGISLHKVCVTISSLQSKGFLVVRKRSEHESNVYAVTVPEEVKGLYFERSCGEQGCSYWEHPVPIGNTPVPIGNTRISNEGYPIKDKMYSSSSSSKTQKNTGKLSLSEVLSGCEPNKTLSNHSGFMEAWQRFVQYKLKRCGAKVTIRAFVLELKTLARYPDPRTAIEAMEQAERCGWQGLQEYKPTKGRVEAPQQVRYNSIGQRI
jgi:hypothetical protein